LIAVVMSFFFLREERLPAIGLAGIVVSVGGVIVLLVAR
jgi:drug/metabolite transporter (DMT)-like permease